nr:hypothetical protein [Pelagibacteraceae bacterium]
MTGKLKDNNTVNHNIDLLNKFDLSDKNSFEVFNESTRDISNLNVLKCKNSGVIVLEKFIISEDYYEKNIHNTDEFKGNTETIKGLIKSKPLEDDIRRFESYKELISGSEILDFGCGRGGFIQLSNKISKRSVGLELNKTNREYLNNIGVQCVNTLSEL